MLEALTLFCCSASLLQEKGELWKRQNHTNRLLQSRHGLTSVRCRRRTAFPNLLAAFLMRLDTQPALLSYCVVGPHSGWHQHSPSFFPAGCRAASQFPACSAPGGSRILHSSSLNLERLLLAQASCFATAPWTETLPFWVSATSPKTASSASLS